MNPSLAMKDSPAFIANEEENDDNFVIIGYTLASESWSPYTKLSARKIEQTQRRATKMEEKLQDVPYSD